MIAIPETALCCAESCRRFTAEQRITHLLGQPLDSTVHGRWSFDRPERGHDPAAKQGIENKSNLSLTMDRSIIYIMEVCYPKIEYLNAEL
jgi:hypothetical protein